MPLLARPVPAGLPLSADNQFNDRLSLDVFLGEHREDTFLARVSGDSMTGFGIHDGDLLVVDRALRPADRSVVIAVVDGEFTVKQLCRLPEGDPPARQWRGPWGHFRGRGAGFRHLGRCALVHSRHMIVCLHNTDYAKSAPRNYNFAGCFQRPTVSKHDAHLLHGMVLTKTPNCPVDLPRRNAEINEPCLFPDDLL
ncbi:MAG: hypothetical protein M5R42_09755 [Rhodocyclaceae bacterium]|nr:hypothetical protein [Rhodocyclaceae bacterium]